MKTTKEQIEQTPEQRAIEFLKKHLKPGTKVYTTVTRVSSSGMSRDIKVAIPMKTDQGLQIIDIGWYVSHLTGHKLNPDNHSIKVGGCGMDMGFELVYTIGYCLYPKGFKLPKGERGRNGDTSGFDKDGGYALHQQWL